VTNSQQAGDELLISLFLPTQVLDPSLVGEQIDLVDEAAIAAQAGGFDGLFALQHMGAPSPILQPIPLLSRLSAVAPDMHLGTCILILPLHVPFLLAEDVATLDHLCGGRVILGVGAGYRPEEFAAAHADRTRRGNALSEGIRELKEFWSTEGRDVGEKQISVVPAQDGGPPIWVGATSRAAVERAARDADAWLPAPTARMDEIARGWKMHEEMREQFGRAPSMVRPLMRDVVMTDVDNRAFGYMQGEFQRYANHGVPIVLRDVEGDEGGAFLVGTADWVTSQLVAAVESGFNHIILRCGWSGQPREVVLNQLEGLTSRVIPALRAASSAIRPTPAIVNR
jgi:alkanesulfonate monooxygenase SsuD/methylene tetrahydromethanopterin reductase-like flavin-dependent oxidoreductase (luciferase family)